MQKINKVLAVMLVMALCSSAELGAVIFANPSNSTGITGFNTDTKEMQTDGTCYPYSEDAMKRAPTGTRFYFTKRGGSPLKYWYGIKGEDGSVPFYGELDLAPEAEQDTHYSTNVKSQFRTWQERLEELKQAGSTLGLNDYTWGKKTLADLDSTIDAESLLMFGVATQLGLSEAEANNPDTKKRLFPKGWNLAQAKSLINTEDARRFCLETTGKSAAEIAALEEKTTAELKKYKAAYDQLDIVVAAKQELARAKKALANATASPMVSANSSSAEPVNTTRLEAAVTAAQEKLTTELKALKDAHKALPEVRWHDARARTELAAAERLKLGSDKLSDEIARLVAEYNCHTTLVNHLKARLADELAAQQTETPATVDSRPDSSSAIEEVESELSRAQKELAEFRTKMGIPDGVNLDAAVTDINRLARGKLARKMKERFKAHLTKELARYTNVLDELAQDEAALNAREPKTGSDDYDEAYAARQREYDYIAAEKAAILEKQKVMQARLNPTERATFASIQQEATEQAAAYRAKAKALRSISDAELVRKANAEYKLLRSKFDQLGVEARELGTRRDVPAELITEIKRQQGKLAARVEAFNTMRYNPKAYFAAEAQKLEAKAQKCDAVVTALKKAAEKAQTDAKAKAAAALAAQGWTYKQIIGFNAITYVAATVAQNMLEGWVGVDVTGTDKRTPKQKALDALKAIVALDKHKAHFVELYRTFKPAPAAQGEVTPKFAKRLARYVKAKPFFSAGVTTLVVGNGYMAATSATMKNLVAKAKGAPKG